MRILVSSLGNELGLAGFDETILRVTLECFDDAFFVNLGFTCEAKL